MNNLKSMDYVSLNTILINWETFGLSPFEMNEDEHTTISGVAESGTIISQQAQSILHWVFGTEYIPEVIDTGFARLMKPSDATDFESNDNWIKTIKPNPAKDNITIDFADMLPNDAEIQLSDYMGRIVKRIALKDNNKQIAIDISTLANGIYNLQLLIGKVPQQAKQFNKL